MRINACKELNWFDHYNTLESIENKQIDTVLHMIDNKTSKLVNKSDNSQFVIIHRCTKQGYTNMIQCSYFDNNGAYSDIVRDNLKEILKYINVNNYRVMEVA